MAEPEVLTKFSDDFSMCTITLNRPSKLNALNLNMIRLLHQAVDQVDAKSSTLRCLLLDGAGGKAFCAGGDVQLIREEALAGGSLPADFFFEEYGIVFRLATLLQRTGCCQASLFDGITMGGGVGLGAHGPIRIVTEKTRFAMPEMAIGLFPDVGATYLLSHLKAGANVGRFLGMTGTTINAWDCLAAGVGTHFVPSARIEHLRRSLSARLSTASVTASAARATIEEAILDAAAGALPEPNGAVLTSENLEVIERCFSATAVEDIVSRLRADGGSFAKAALEKLYQSCSPTSCKVTLEAMRRVIEERLDITGVLLMEYRLSQRFTTRPQPLSDFHEGIRAVLVDKDRKQKWNPRWDRLNATRGASCTWTKMRSVRP
eukprot:TRINITY_DN22351_c0_g1_i2.p1 TRINITY_DN22351_c0_g1~~TRINITY_DN22351_c0_g1_i2.p1  ORF type:complete len:392 (+),score=60.83 TRINITY_DN22351_c0_g1_i2:49-1176(+)